MNGAKKIIEISEIEKDLHRRVRGHVFLANKDLNQRIGYPNCEVILWKDQPAGEIVDKTFTKADGSYEFIGMKDGIYAIEANTPIPFNVHLPWGFKVLKGKADPGKIDLELYYDWDAHPGGMGFVRGHVFLVNKDLNQRIGYPNCEVILWKDQPAGEIVEKTLTKVDGSYEFCGIKDGIYAVEANPSIPLNVHLPWGFKVSKGKADPERIDLELYYGWEGYPGGMP